MTPSRRRPAPPHRWLRGRRRLAACFSLCAALSGAPAVTAAPAAPVLTTGTTITWTGNTGMLLTIPPQTTLPSYGARLFLRGGSYAVVRYKPRGTCPEHRCEISGYLDYTRALAGLYGSMGGGPGADHRAGVGSGPRPPGVYEVYLFTDGEATLVFDRTGQPRVPRTHRPRGKIAGGVVPLPVTCVNGPCAPDGYAGRLQAGGVTVDVGRLGNVDYLVGSRDTAPLVPAQSHSVRGCFDFTETDPATHPLGCDAASVGGDAAFYEGYNTASFVAGSATPIRGGMVSTDSTWAVSGKVYVGHQRFTAHDLGARQAVAYATWLTFGVH